MPSFPKPDKSGRFPALEYTRVQFARNLSRQRNALGLSEHRLAALAGVRLETLSRVESGKQVISGKAAAKLERALAAAQKRRPSRTSSNKSTR
jgi:ribosome-binding protein aMBF1 (putative translation factor)